MAGSGFMSFVRRKVDEANRTKQAVPLSPTDPTYENIIGKIQEMQGVPGLSDTAIPQIQGILGQSSRYLTPQLEAIDRDTEAMAAKAQSDAMRRGLTGSDIELANITGARTAGGQRKAEVRGQFGLNQANVMSDLIFKAASGDQQSELSILTLLAQAMGQELTSQRDIEMFRQQLSQMDKESRRAFWGSVIGGGLGGVGGAIGGLGK
jgi:hypothetical protein